VEFDGHKLDVRLTLRIDDPFRFETLLVLHRIWLRLLLDVASRAVIGFALALGREYNSDDVAQALQSALMFSEPFGQLLVTGSENRGIAGEQDATGNTHGNEGTCWYQTNRRKHDQLISLRLNTST
jgi:hypothetical protein